MQVLAWFFGRRTHGCGGTAFGWRVFVFDFWGVLSVMVVEQLGHAARGWFLGAKSERLQKALALSPHPLPCTLLPHAGTFRGPPP